MSVLVKNVQRRLKIGRPAIAKILELCRESTNHGGWSVGCRITSGAAIAKLNRQYRGKSDPTDCLSFTAQDWAAPEKLAADNGFQGQRDLGDIILAADVIVADCRMDGIRTLPALDEYCAKVIVHSYVHLLGYDHDHERDAALMQQKESEVWRSIQAWSGDGGVDGLHGDTASVPEGGGSARMPSSNQGGSKRGKNIFYEDALMALLANEGDMDLPVVKTRA